MRKLIYLGIILLLLLNCSEDSGNNSNSNDNNNSLLNNSYCEVSIDGTKWEANTEVIATKANIAEIIYTYIGATRSEETNSTVVDGFGLNIYGTETGMFQVDSQDVSIVYTVVNGSKGYYSSSGQINISESTSEIVVGTFSGQLINVLDENDKITVTNGKFRANIQQTGE